MKPFNFDYSIDDLNFELHVISLDDEGGEFAIYLCDEPLSDKQEEYIMSLYYDSIYDTAIEIYKEIIEARKTKAASIIKYGKDYL